MTIENDPLSHVTTRRLTKSWEYGSRMLYGYDFTTDRFFDRPSRTLLVADQSFGHEVERFLNHRIERHLATHLDDLADGTWTSTIPWEQERALMLSMICQPLRLEAARGNLAPLKDFITKDEAYLNKLAVGSRTMFRFVSGKLAQGPGQTLYFPEDGLAGLPMFGTSGTHPAMLFQPTTLSTFFGAIPIGLPEKEADKQLQEAMESGVVAAFSVGLKCDRVLIPPFIRDNSTEDKMRAGLHILRDTARQFDKTVFAVNRKIGF